MFYIVRQMFFFTLAKVHTHYGLAKGFSLNPCGKIPIVLFPAFYNIGLSLLKCWFKPLRLLVRVFWLLLVFLYVSTYATLYAATQLVQLDGVGQFHNSIDNHGPAYNE